MPTILPHRKVRPPECPGARVVELLPEIRDEVARRLGRSEIRVPGDPAPGYRILTARGFIADRGNLPQLGEPLGGGAGTRSVALAPAARGYWALGRDGGVFAFGGAPDLGSLQQLRREGPEGGAPAVDITATPTGRGYSVLDARGGVHAFGDARFHGSIRGEGFPARAVRLTPSPTGVGTPCSPTTGPCSPSATLPSTGTARVCPPPTSPSPPDRGR